MSGKRIWKNVGRYALRFVTLLIAISIVSFVLVSLSPVDPVQQYVGCLLYTSWIHQSK